MNKLDDSIKISFTKRKSPIPVDYRPLYKIAQILLIIVICGRGGKISLPKLQFFIWALKTPDNMRAFKALLEGELNFSLWSLDPTVIRALNFAIGERLCERHGGNIAVTQKGQSFVTRLRAEKLLRHHTFFLEQIGKQVTEEKVRQIAKEWLKEC